MLPPPFSLDERDPDHPLDDATRLKLTAAILARGLRRLRDHPPSLPVPDPQKPGESPSTPLAFLSHDPLTVTVR